MTEAYGGSAAVLEWWLDRAALPDELTDELTDENPRDGGSQPS
jgi:hypothetical protein